MNPCESRCATSLGAPLAETIGTTRRHDSGRSDRRFPPLFPPTPSRTWTSRRLAVAKHSGAVPWHCTSELPSRGEDVAPALLLTCPAGGHFPQPAILQHHPQAQGRFQALGVSHVTQGAEVAVRRFVQVGAARCAMSQSWGALGDLGHIQALTTAQGARAVLEDGQPGESGDGRFPCGRAVTPRCNAKTFSQPELRPDVDSQCSIRGTLHRSTARSNSIKQERNGEQ